MQSVEIMNSRFSKGVKVKYKVPLLHDASFIETDMVFETPSPSFNHSHVIRIEQVSQEHLDFLDQGCIIFCLYGKQNDNGGDGKLTNLTTRVRRWIISLTVLIFKDMLMFCYLSNVFIVLIVCIEYSLRLFILILDLISAFISLCWPKIVSGNVCGDTAEV